MTGKPACNAPSALEKGLCPFAADKYIVCFRQAKSTPAFGDLMPHTRSAKKSLRKNEERRRHNRAIKRDIKTQIKKVLEADASSVEQLRAEYNLAAKKLDKAAAKRIVHPNLA